MKRFAALLLILLLCLNLCACGGKTQQNAEAAAAEAALNTETDGMKLSQTTAVSKEKFEKETKFADFLSDYEKAFVIPGLNEGAIPQGMACCADTGKIYISSYYTLDLPSVITAVDAESGEFCAEYFLYNPDGTAFNSHVGGLACTGDKLCVSATLDNDGSYSIGVLDISALPESGSHEITVSRRVELPVSPSFMNYSGGYLWAGNFYFPNANYDLPADIPTTDGLGCYILGYALSRELNEDCPMPDVVIAAPDRIQGFTMTGEGTAMLSQSYGRKNDSTLYEYYVNLNSAPEAALTINGTELPLYVLRDDALIKSVTAMPMTEALCLDSTGKVMVLFESGALHYADGLFRTDCVWKMK